MVQWLAARIDEWMSEKQQAHEGLDQGSEVEKDANRSGNDGKAEDCPSAASDKQTRDTPSTQYVFIVDEAVANGHLVVLEWLQAVNYAWLKMNTLGSGVGKAIRIGHFNTVRWMGQNFFLRDEPGMQLMDCAIRGGHIEILRWLEEVGTFEWLLDAVVGAAHGGHLEMIQWFHKHYEECLSYQYAVPERTREVMDAAAAEGHLAIVKFLHENRTEGCSRFAMIRAADNGYLDMVKWLHVHCKKGCSTDAKDKAAANNDFAMVSWLAEHCTEGCSTDAIGGATHNGHLDMIKWLHAHDAKETANALDMAAWLGHLDVVRWLNEHRSDGSNGSAMDAAAAEGHLDVIQYLHENRPEGCSTHAMDRVAEGGHLNVVKWLHEHRQEGCTSDAIGRAAANGHLDVVRWLVETKGCPVEAIEEATRSGHVDVVMYLASHHHGVYPGDICDALSLLYCANRLELFQWLSQHYPDEFAEGVRECVPSEDERVQLKPYMEVWLRDRHL